MGDSYQGFQLNVAKTTGISTPAISFFSKYTATKLNTREESVLISSPVVLLSIENIEEDIF